MRLLPLIVITAACTLTTALARGGGAARDAGVLVVSPKQDAKVEKVTEVTGKAMKNGWPIVLVKADQPGCRWWVQKYPDKKSDGHFKTSAIFGNDETPEHSLFRLVVLMAPTKEIAKRFVPGQTLEELPDDIGRSADMRYIFQREKVETDVIPGVIHTPAADAGVGRVETLEGNVRGDTRPVVLVRADDNLWWVQAIVAPQADGSFAAATRFGNDKTPMGTRFNIVVIMPTPEQAEAYAAGMTMHELPQGIPRSDVVSVVRRAAPTGG